MGGQGVYDLSVRQFRPQVDSPSGNGEAKKTYACVLCSLGGIDKRWFDTVKNGNFLFAKLGFLIEILFAS
jgi:hypothetical protein